MSRTPELLIKMSKQQSILVNMLLDILNLIWNCVTFNHGVNFNGQRDTLKTNFGVFNKTHSLLTKL